MNLEPADYAGFNGSAVEAPPQDQSSVADSQLLFKMVDSNADGKLSSMEIVSHLSNMGVPGRDIEQLFEELDTNNDGVVSKQELIAGYSRFVDTVSKANKQNRESILDSQLLFNLADTNGDGLLSTEELSNHLSDLGVPAEELDRLLLSLDTNGDGQVTRQEFLSGYNSYYETLHTACFPEFALQTNTTGIELDHWLQQDIEPDWLLDLDNQADPNANCPGLLDIEVDWLTDRTAATPVKAEPNPNGEGNQELLLSGTQELLLSGAQELVMLSFDAMAVVAAGSQTVLSSNPAFLQMALTLGGNNMGRGISLLQQNFLKELSLEGGSEIHYSSGNLKLDGASKVLAINSAIKCTAPHQNCSSLCAQENCSLLWVLASRPGTPEKIEINEPHFADPDLKVMADPTVNKRKRPKAQQSEAPQAPEPQKMWQKYGERAVSSHGKHAQDTIMRAYYKCYSKDCPARLWVDCDRETGSRLKISATGAHNHYVTLCEPIAIAAP